MKKKSSFNAVRLRGLLIFTLILVLGLAGVGFYYAYGWIKDYADQVNQTVVNAHASAAPTTSVSTKALQSALAQQTSVTGKLAQFYASPTDFQAKAIQDIDAYAQASGLSIGNVSLGSGTTTASGSTTTPPAVSDQTTLTVKLNTPVSYSGLLKFMTFVQNSLPKMQIQSISLQHSASDTANTVTSDSLTIKVITQR